MLRRDRKERGKIDDVKAQLEGHCSINHAQHPTCALSSSRLSWQIRERTNTMRLDQSQLQSGADDLKPDRMRTEKKKNNIFFPSSSKVLLWALSQKIKFNKKLWFRKPS